VKETYELIVMEVLTALNKGWILLFFNCNWGSWFWNYWFWI